MNLEPINSRTNQYIIRYQIAWITYKRIAVFKNTDIQKAFRAKLLEIANRQNYLVERLDIQDNSISLIVSAPPNVSISVIVQKLKGGTASWLLNKFSDQFSEMHLDKHLWKEKHYFVSTIGKANSDYLDNYLENIR